MHNITNKQKKLMSEIKDYTENLSIFELMIIKKLRLIEYGSLTVFMIDSVPQRTKVETSEVLVSGSPKSFKG